METMIGVETVQRCAEAQSKMQLCDFPGFLELISVLQSNDLEKEKQEVTAMASYLDDMKDQSDAMLEELKEVRGQLNAIQDKGLRAAVLRVANNVEGKLTAARAQIVTAKNNFIQAAGHAVRTFKEHGISAFKQALAAMRMLQALAHIKSGLHGSVEASRQGALKLGEIGKELYEAGQHTKNAGRLLVGKAQKEPVPHNPDKGILGGFQKLLVRAGATFARMEKTTEAALEKLKKPSVKECLQDIRLEKQEKSAGAKTQPEQVR